MESVRHNSVVAVMADNSKVAAAIVVDHPKVVMLANEAAEDPAKVVVSATKRPISS
jgi:hypothetical protein